MKDCNNFSERLLQPTIQTAFKRTVYPYPMAVAV